MLRFWLVSKSVSDLVSPMHGDELVLRTLDTEMLLEGSSKRAWRRTYLGSRQPMEIEMVLDSLVGIGIVG